MPLNLIILIAAVVVSWLVFTALLKVVKTTVSTALAIAAVVLVLQLFFGIGPNQLLEEVVQLPQTLWHLVTGS